MGSTMATTRQRLAEIGGFAALLDLHSDDYELGRRIAASGYRVELAPEPVDMEFPSETLGGYLRHELRWLVGIRHIRPGGHFGLLDDPGNRLDGGGRASGGVPDASAAGLSRISAFEAQRLRGRRLGPGRSSAAPQTLAAAPSRFFHVFPLAGQFRGKPHRVARPGVHARKRPPDSRRIPRHRAHESSA